MKFIVANWKMNPATVKGARELFERVGEGAKETKETEVVICPPFAYLGLLSSSESLRLGGQNCFYENKGAYTGEVSPEMLRELECNYVILGHSERRRIFQETDEMINKKVKTALAAGLKVILCIGESQKEKDAAETKQVLERQLSGGLAGVERNNLIVAYEPVWAIGTGNSCSTENSKDAYELIKSLVDVPVLYGGSVDSSCALRYLNEAGFDGLLIGGASLKADEFIKIVKLANG